LHSFCFVQFLFNLNGRPWCTQPNELDCPKTAIKKFVGSLSAPLLYHIKTKSKNSFCRAKQKRDRIKIATTISFYKTASPALAGRAELILLSKRNGRRFAPPAISSGKKKKVLSWSG